VSLKRVINEPARGIGDKSYEVIRDFVLKHRDEESQKDSDGSDELRLKHYELNLKKFRQALSEIKLAPKQWQATQDFFKLIEELVLVSPDLLLSELMNRIFIRTGYEKYLQDGDKAWCLRLFRRDPLDGCGTKTIAPGSFPIDFTKIEHTSGGEGGSVEGTTLSIDGKKGSHAWLAGAIANKSDMNYIEFDAEFVNGEGAESLLTVYLNDTEIGMVDARVDDGKSHQQFRLYIKHLIGLDPYQPTYVAPGLYSLSFRLDSFQDGKTSVKLSNIKAGLK
jgi:hypothetical protein